MKHLQQYIFENIVNIFEGVDNEVRNKLRAYVSTWLKKRGEKISATKSGEDKEIFRYNLGTNEEAKEILNQIFNIDNNLNVEISDTSEIVGRSKRGSGTYPSFTIKYNGQEFYVANRTLSNSNLKNKELTPDKLKLSFENNKYISFDQLFNTVKPALEKIKIKYPNTNIYELIIEIISKIKNGDFNVEGSFTEKNINDFFNNSNDGKLNFQIDSTIFDNVLQGDINCIEKDFGEILGPFVLFRLFKNVELSYPTISNEPLVDYYINGHKISAKQLGGGGDPSGSSIAKMAKRYRDEIQDNPEEITDETSDLSNKEKRVIFDKDGEIDFIDNVLSTYNEDTFTQQKLLISKFVLNDDINNHIGFNISTLNNQKDLEKKLDNILKNTDIKKYFDKLYELIKYTPKKSSSWTPETISKEYFNVNTKLKWGILFYPLYTVAIKKINDTYNNYNGQDIISSVIQKVTDMKQIYLGIRKKEGLKVEIVSSGVSKWILTIGGMSTNNINRSKMAIKLKHNQK